jgi:aspartate-semialdehyde dehydrogenase
MGLGHLFTDNHIDWVTSMTYQASSGAGAHHMKELLKQMDFLGKKVFNNKTSDNIFDIDEVVNSSFQNPDFPQEYFGHPLALNLLPWIDKEVAGGQSGEEAKAFMETNKILGSSSMIPIDSTCVRVGALRCHSQALTIKLKRDIPLDEIVDMVASSHEWAQVVPNTKEETLKKLTPINVSGKLDVFTGRLRKMLMGGEYLNAFTVGDQLLWGAAEPLRRTLMRIVR